MQATKPPTGPPGQHENLRVIGPIASFAIVAGSMLGVGIFLFPGKIAYVGRKPVLNVHVNIFKTVCIFKSTRFNLLPDLFET